MSDSKEPRTGIEEIVRKNLEMMRSSHEKKGTLEFGSATIYPDKDIKVLPGWGKTYIPFYYDPETGQIIYFCNDGGSERTPLSIRGNYIEGSLKWVIDYHSNVLGIVDVKTPDIKPEGRKALEKSVEAYNRSRGFDPNRYWRQE